VTLTQRDDLIETAYWTFLHLQHLSADDVLETAFSAGWMAGGASVLRSSARLAELVPAMREIIAWFEVDE